MKLTTPQYVIMFLVLTTGCIFITEQRAEADTRWVKKVVTVPYTYYEYETQTRYRLVRKAFTVIEYRYECRAVTTYRYEPQRVAVEIPSRHWGGVTRIRYVWKNVRVPETTYKQVRVPYEKTVYRTVREAYKVRVKVERTGYRNELQWVKVCVPDVPDRKCHRYHRGHNSWNDYNDSSFEYSSGGFTITLTTGDTGEYRRCREYNSQIRNHCRGFSDDYGIVESQTRAGKRFGYRRRR